MMSDKVIPFTCAECGTQFDPEHGGICDICNRVFCYRHLTRWIGDEYLCQTCIRAVDGLKKGAEPEDAK